MMAAKPLTLANLFTRLNDHHTHHATGMITEAALFEVLSNLKIPHIRAEENAPSDGALFLVHKQEGLPPLPTDPTERLDWALQYQDTHLSFITFDVKSFGLRSFRSTDGGDLSVLQRHNLGLRYENSVYSQGADKEDTHGLPSHFYILYSLAEPDLFIIMPNHYYEELTRRSTVGLQGLGGLRSRLPPSIAPFVVERQYLAEAMRHVGEVAQQQSQELNYTNPSTKVQIAGWKPQPGLADQLLPLHEVRRVKSRQAINDLKRRINALPDVRFYNNPVSPLIADFLIQMKGVSEPLTIEHKFGKCGNLNRVGSFRNPFAPSRQWNFLIWQPDHGQWYCIPRSEMDLEWNKPGRFKLPSPEMDKFYYEGHDGVRKMIKDMASKAADAIDASFELIRSWGNPQVDNQGMGEDSSEGEHEKADEEEWYDMDEGEGEEEARIEDRIPADLGLSAVDGYKVNSKGIVLDAEGEQIAKLCEGELEQCTGKEINGKGEVLGKDGTVLGKVELVDKAPEKTIGEAMNVDDGPDLSAVKGYRVNSKGNVLDEEGDQIAKLSEGEPERCSGKKLNKNGEVLDEGGNVIGKVELVKPEDEEAENETTAVSMKRLHLARAKQVNQTEQHTKETGVAAKSLAKHVEESVGWPQDEDEEEDEDDRGETTLERGPDTTESDKTNDLSIPVSEENLRNSHGLGLFWLGDLLNDFAAQARRGVYLPLDPGHALGNHIGVDYHWTDADVGRWQTDRILPISLFSSKARALLAVPFLFMEMHQVYWPTHQVSSLDQPGLYMNTRFWTEKPCKQDFILVGGTSEPLALSCMASEEQPRYLFLPSEKTTWPRKDQPDPDQIDAILTPATLIRGRYSNPITRGFAPFTYGSEFVREGVDPELFYLRIQAIYEHTLNILENDGMSTFTLKKQQFEKSRYRLTVQEFNQALLVYGVRKIVNAAKVTTNQPFFCPLADCVRNRSGYKVMSGLKKHFASKHPDEKLADLWKPPSEQQKHIAQARAKQNK